MAKKVSYLTKWCQGIKEHFNITVEFMGLQNEGQVTGGNEQFATALRASLDAAGFVDTLIDCCDGHDFSFLPQMADPESDFFKAVGEFGEQAFACAVPRTTPLSLSRALSVSVSVSLSRSLCLSLSQLSARLPARSAWNP